MTRNLDLETLYLWISSLNGQRICSGLLLPVYPSHFREHIAFDKGQGVKKHDDRLLDAMDDSLLIPLNKEQDMVLDRLGAPEGWMIPCLIGRGTRVLEQYDSGPDGRLYRGKW